jgi:hypothetical protein
MKRPLAPFVFIAISLMTSSLLAQSQQDADVQKVDIKASSAVGTYVGDFGPHKITVCVEKIVGRTLMGYSIVAGNERAFSGAWQTVPVGIAFIGKEPGDHAQDGIFTLSFDSSAKVLYGTWQSQNKKKPETVQLMLQRREFKYDKKVGVYPQGSTRLLKVADVENLRQNELRLMRNEIYARHGYSFSISDMQEHFAKQDWYMPRALDIKDQLTVTELRNEALIRRYETYGAQYYDRFGR